MAQHVRYTHGHHESVLRSHRWRTVENSAAYLLPYLQPGRSLLDVGCGPATITADLAQRVAPGRVLGIDAAKEIVAEARADAGPDAPFELEVGDALALSVPDASFDIVHAHQLLQHLPDPVAALGEMSRAVRPDGVIAVRDGDYGAMSWYPEDERLERWRTLYRAIARSNGGEPDAGRHLLAWAHAAGLRDVIPTASVWCFATEADRRWWGDLWAARVTESALARQALEEDFADRRDLEDMADGWRAWARHPDGWFCAPNAELIARRPD